MHLLTAVLLIVTVKTYDGYGVPAADLRTAIAVASTTLAAAGIATDWIDCGSEAAALRCRAVTGRNEVIVRISHAPGGRRNGDTLGVAAVDTEARAGSLATLYADRIGAHALAAGSDSGTLLGRAAAHEIGHLLMGTTAHARQGLMRARWFQSDLQRRFQREWRFSPQEAEQMRARLAARSSEPSSRSPRLTAESNEAARDGL